ncbi:gp089 [Rhodococcus phage ReqiPepy6]|uniref:Gp089 n=1 Tax=Rhodococcus phage ReqiPepy6 TaxID=691965 RepID=D4P7K0_9CAUD|nr:gp089 [Rhodococcus phage ReqiPepy6]ADD80980.1 gp089 [Rhodococcus phage ReqiPepy6]
MTHWELILVGILVVGLVLANFKKTRMLGMLISFFAPLFLLFYFLIDGRYELVSYLLTFMLTYTLLPYMWGKNEKKEETK